MTDLHARLEAAGGTGPASFDAGDIAARARRRHRRRRRVAAGAVAVMVAAAAGAVVAVGSGDGDRPPAGPISASELTESPWILTAVGAVTTINVTSSVTFEPSGVVHGADRCGPFTGRWQLDGDRLSVTEVAGDADRCTAAGSQSLAQFLADGATLGHSDLDEDGLRLAGRPGLHHLQQVWLRRLDDIPPVTDPAALAYRWRSDAGPSLAVSADGTLTSPRCPDRAGWTLDQRGWNDEPPSGSCLADTLGLSTPGPWPVRAESGRLYVQDGPAVVGLSRTTSSVPTPFDDLLGSRWVVRGLPGVGAQQGVAWLGLAHDGTVVGSNGSCGVFRGTWTIDGAVLIGNDLQGPPTISCASPTFDLLTALARGLTFARPDGDPAGLELRDVDPEPGGPSTDPPLGWALTRFDRMGTPADRDAIVGRWAADDGWSTIVFAADGTVRLSLSGCTVTRRWTMAGEVTKLGDEVVPGCGSIPQLSAPGDVLIRIEGDRLWLSSDAGIVTVRRD